MGTTRREWREALADADRAVALQPGDGSLHRARAYVLGSLGRTAEELTAARRGADLEPLAGRSWAVLAKALMFGGDLDGARRAWERHLELAPDSTGCRRELAILAVLQGRADEALERIRPLAAASVDRLLALAMVERARGDEAASRRRLAQASATHGYTWAFQIAEVHAWRGDADQAFAWLDRAEAQDDGGLMELKSSLLLRPLHSDPRWAALLKQLGLPVE